MTENETQTQGQLAQKMTPEELQGELDKIETMWVKVPKGEAIVARFTGSIYKRMASFKDKNTGAPLPPTAMIDFELEDTMKEEGPDKGKHKTISRNMKNSDVQKILDFFKQGKLELMLSADNSGKVSVAAVKR